MKYFTESSINPTLLSCYGLPSFPSRFDSFALSFMVYFSFQRHNLEIEIRMRYPSPVQPNRILGMKWREHCAGSLRFSSVMFRVWYDEYDNKVEVFGGVLFPVF